MSVVVRSSLIWTDGPSPTGGYFGTWIDGVHTASIDYLHSTGRFVLMAQSAADWSQADFLTKRAQAEEWMREMLEEFSSPQVPFPSAAKLEWKPGARAGGIKVEAKLGAVLLAELEWKPVSGIVSTAARGALDLSWTEYGVLNLAHKLIAEAIRGRFLLHVP